MSIPDEDIVVPRVEEATYLSGVIAGARTLRSKRLRRELYQNDPVLWAEEYLGLLLWSKQKEILYSIRDIRATAVAAGHGVGKTYVAAVACAWWVDIHPVAETFIASTAPSKDQVDLLWDNIRRIHDLAGERYEHGMVDHALPGYITGDNKWKLPNGSLLGQGRKPPDNKADIAFQGRHATYLMAIGDEAVGIPEGFLDALSNIATGDHNRRLLLANPTDPHSAMAKIWEREDPSWNRMHISVFDSPRVTGEAGFEGEEFSAMSGWNYINERKEEWGEDDPRYIARVLGQWAFEAGDMVFTAEDLARAKNTVVIPDDYAFVRFGIDVARSPKGDFSVVYRCQEGDVWEVDAETGELVRPTGERGEQLRFVDRWKGAPLTGSNPNNLGSDYRIDAFAKEYGASFLNIDVAGGYGGGVQDGLVEIGSDQYVIVEVWGGDTSSVDRREYINARVFNYFELKRKMHAGLLDIDPKDETLLEELQGITYEHDSAGRLKIESKDDMRRRGRKSPDHADAAWYACMDVSHLFGPQPGDVAVWDESLVDESLEPFYSGIGRYGW